MKHVPGFKWVNHSINLKALCKCLQFSVHLSCLMDQGLHQLWEYTGRCLSGGFQDCMYTRTLWLKMIKNRGKSGEKEAKSSVACCLCLAVVQTLWKAPCGCSGTWASAWWSAGDRSGCWDTALPHLVFWLPLSCVPGLQWHFPFGIFFLKVYLTMAAQTTKIAQPRGPVQGQWTWSVI